MKRKYFLRSSVKKKLFPYYFDIKSYIEIFIKQTEFPFNKFSYDEISNISLFQKNFEEKCFKFYKKIKKDAEIVYNKKGISFPNVYKLKDILFKMIKK
jgi:hypothetical protein